jgi:hypothetical protein
MRVYTRVEFEWNGEQYVPVHEEFYEYDGPVAQLKKGRDVVDKNMKETQKYAGEAKGIQTGARNKAEGFVSGLESTKPGELSPLAQAQYANDVDNIVDTHGKNMEVGLRMLKTRGMGSAPAGAVSSLVNSANEASGRDQTMAYRNAQGTTYGQGLEALRYRTAQQDMYNPLNAWNSSSNQAAQRSQMGSLMGDIGTGLKTGIGIARDIGKMATGNWS